MINDIEKWQEVWNGVDYPLYHSTYDTFDAMKRHIDPDFSYHLALGQLWGYVGFALADIPLLPFSVEDEAEVLNTVVDDIEAKYGPVLAKHSVSLGLFNPFQRPFQ